MTAVVAERLASQVADPLTWIDALVEADSVPDLVLPFLSIALKDDNLGRKAWSKLASIERYRHIGVSAALSAERISPEIIHDALRNLDGCRELVETACIRGEVPEDRLLLLLRHDSGEIAEAAAIGVWHASNGASELPDAVRQAWEEATTRHVTAKYVLEEVFVRFPHLAEEWIIAHQGKKWWQWSWEEREALEVAARALNRDFRQRLLAELTADSFPPEFFNWLVNSDLEVYPVLLSRKDLSEVHLEPLVGPLNEQWIRLAQEALDAGYSVEEVARAPHRRGWTWVGKESLMWKEWVEAFARLDNHTDTRIREIGRIGRQGAEQAMVAAVERERDEEIIGR